jgi:branched-chain amino acid transport system ATP-binding protein
MLAIGRGLMLRPVLLMLDEPSLGLASKLVDEMFATIRVIADEGMTILLVEQNVRESLELADRAYALQTGRTVLAGTGEELLDSDLVREAYLGL